MSTAVFFDLDGTLVEFTEPYREVIEATLNACLGRSTSKLIETYNENFYEAFVAIEPEPYLCGMRAVRAEAESDVAPEVLVSELYEREVAMTAVNEGARTLIESLSERHQLGVITNGVPEWQRGKLAHHGLLERFEAVVTSYEAGGHKPDPAPFALARERVDADTCVMIGDDYEADIEGGRQAGFVPVHLDRKATGGTQVSDLGALSNLLDSLA